MQVLGFLPFLHYCAEKAGNQDRLTGDAGCRQSFNGLERPIVTAPDEPEALGEKRR
jgi:hypothetical protein